MVVCLSVCPLAYLNKSSAVAEMGDRLARIDTGQKAGAPVPLSVGQLGPHLTQCRLGRGVPPYQVDNVAVAYGKLLRRGVNLVVKAQIRRVARLPCEI